MRSIINLECEECGSRNYTTNKNKKNTSEKIVLKKYCKKDRKKTLHKETK